MSEHTHLLQSIADIIADYREGEITKPTPDHVERWIKQFDAPVQVPTLSEMAHVLGKTYIAKAGVGKFLKTAIMSEKLAGADPWRQAAGIGRAPLAHIAAKALGVPKVALGAPASGVEICQDARGSEPNSRHIRREIVE